VEFKRDGPELLRLWWIPMLGLFLIAWALRLHDKEPEGDSHFELALLGAGSAMVARAERSFYRTRIKRDDPFTDFLTPPPPSRPQPKQKLRVVFSDRPKPPDPPDAA
jgi:hypothetical protein